MAIQKNNKKMLKISIFLLFFWIASSIAMQFPRNDAKTDPFNKADLIAGSS
ncbi:hypothetical protein RAMDARK_1289 [Rickettsia amblyommatis str. Darkwater]|uniref:Uncharacterized protein n=1 Tax=Rickettsia amblyommatis str. Ac/Pa TaxID=1359164 RepID=A0A0F3N4R9_RICAM|nr:hypothetical protein APHACPA_1711 [Rickettsia amblyommatis str. Ac/Pa]KJV90807.1 hypothetical protein RAMDARK_1289 [Rickettsia amblyommatis str. Darkwater]